MEEEVEQHDAASPAASTQPNSEERREETDQPPMQKMYALMRHLLRRHLAALHEERTSHWSSVEKLRGVYAELMSQASPFKDETPASWMNDVDRWAVQFAYSRHHLQVVSAQVAEARKEYRILTGRYRNWDRDV